MDINPVEIFYIRLAFLRFHSICMLTTNAIRYIFHILSLAFLMLTVLTYLGNLTNTSLNCSQFYQPYCHRFFIYENAPLSYVHFFTWKINLFFIFLYFIVEIFIRSKRIYIMWWLRICVGSWRIMENVFPCESIMKYF